MGGQRNSMVCRPVLIFLLTVMLLVGLLSFVHIRLGSAGILSKLPTFEDNDDLFDGRYLAEDDDRHNDGPNQNEATNNPTIFGYTRSVSKKDTTNDHSSYLWIWGRRDRGYVSPC